MDEKPRCLILCPLSKGLEIQMCAYVSLPVLALPILSPPATRRPFPGEVGGQLTALQNVLEGACKFKKAQAETCQTTALRSIRSPWSST